MSIRKLTALIFGLSALFLAFSLSAPASFPVGATFEIPEGATLSKTAQILKEKNVIHSVLLFRAYVTYLEGDKSVMSGYYFFGGKLSLFSVARRVTEGDYEIPKVKVTFPEGSTVFDIADILKAAMPEFDKNTFIGLAKNDEGFLFPDTYFFFSILTPKEAKNTMRDNFDAKIKDIEPKIKASGHTLDDVIVMASLVEKETKTPEDRRIVAGILWKRLAMNMPLQVDAAFNYVNGKNTYDLTADDLKIDSRYNTYKYKGLPPGPIANPGLDAILAAIEPTTTPYLYYLSEKDGTMHYAKTFEEHKKNKVTYLN